MSSERITLGKKGEACVADYLKTQGFSLCAQNYQTRQGEIDVIARKDELLVFVEVKIRTKTYFPLHELVPYAKQRKIIKTAFSYILTNKIDEMIYRFDVALLEISPLGSYTVTYLANAFTVPETSGNGAMY